MDKLEAAHEIYLNLSIKLRLDYNRELVELIKKHNTLAEQARLEYMKVKNSINRPEVQ